MAKATDADPGLLDKGLSERSPIGEPKSAGMDTKGKDQKPMATPRQSISEKGKTFTIC